MAVHVLEDPVGVAQESGLAQVVDLVRTDRPLGEVGEEAGQSHPDENEAIETIADRWLTTLTEQEQRAQHNPRPWSRGTSRGWNHVGIFYPPIIRNLMTCDRLNPAWPTIGPSTARRCLPWSSCVVNMRPTSISYLRTIG